MVKFRKTRIVLGALIISVFMCACGGNASETSSESTSESSVSSVSVSSSSEGEIDEDAYKDIAGVYFCNLSVEGGMDVDLFLEIKENGDFVFSRSTDFSDKEKGAGYLGVDDEGNDAFIYEIVKDKEVEEGEYVSTYEQTDEGGIQFTSLMWFGSTTPRFTDDDGGETYPLFVIYDENAVTETPTPTETETPTPTATETPTPEPTQVAAASPSENEGYEIIYETIEVDDSGASQSVSVDGTYSGSLDKYVDAMGSNIHYDITLTISGGSYSYSVGITVSGGMEYSGSESYSGSCSADGTYISLSDPLYDASYNNGSLTITGYLSSFAGSMETVTLY